MKTIKLLFVAIIMIASYSLTAQVSINSDGSIPDASAMLDVKSTSKVFLPPRMTEAQMNAITIGLIATVLLSWRWMKYSTLQQVKYGKTAT
jgi:hypothetical protein